MLTLWRLVMLFGREWTDGVLILERPYRLIQSEAPPASNDVSEKCEISDDGVDVPSKNETDCACERALDDATDQRRE
jgi:hypothetical protein